MPRGSFEHAGDAQVSLLQRIMSWPSRHLQQAIGSLGDLWRTPIASLMTILVLGITLTLPTTLHVFVKNAEKVTQQWHSASEITLFLKLSISDKAARNLVERLKLYPEIAHVELITAQQALAEFKKLSGFGQALDYLDNNPLPYTILVTPTKRASQAEAVRQLLAKLIQQREVEQGKLDLEWLTRLEAMAELIQDIVISIAFLLCLSAVLIIGNTIRLAILNQKDAIAIMKLVGATDQFIQRPFLYTGMWYGVFGGILAIFIEVILIAYLSYAVNNLTGLYQSDFSLQGLSLSEALSLILFAIILGLVGSYLSVKQHISAIEPTTD
jgi:cell division transport system permease protein